MIVALLWYLHLLGDLYQ